MIFTRARVLLAPLFLRENGDYSQSTAVPADQTTYDPKRLRWNREQECENYGAEKDNQGKDDREKGKELRGKPGVT